MSTGPLGAVEHSAVTELRGPLLVVRDVHGVGWDEFAEIRLDSGEVRHGLVLEVDGDLAVVQVLEGTDGDAPGHDPGHVRRARPCTSRSAPGGWAGSATAAATPSTGARRCCRTTGPRCPASRSTRRTGSRRPSRC